MNIRMETNISGLYSVDIRRLVSKEEVGSVSDSFWDDYTRYLQGNKIVDIKPLPYDKTSVKQKVYIYFIGTGDVTETEWHISDRHVNTLFIFNKYKPLPDDLFTL